MGKKKTNKRKDLEESLRQAVRNSGLTRYAVAKGAGIDVAGLLRFMSGQRTLTLPSAAKLAAFLELELQPSRKR